MLGSIANYVLLDFDTEPADTPVAKANSQRKLAELHQAPDVLPAIRDAIDFIQLLEGAKLQRVRHSRDP